MAVEQVEAVGDGPVVLGREEREQRGDDAVVVADLLRGLRGAHVAGVPVEVRLDVDRQRVERVAHRFELVSPQDLRTRHLERSDRLAIE